MEFLSRTILTQRPVTWRSAVQLFVQVHIKALLDDSNLNVFQAF